LFIFFFINLSCRPNLKSKNQNFKPNQTKQIFKLTNINLLYSTFVERGPNDAFGLVLWASDQYNRRIANFSFEAPVALSSPNATIRSLDCSAWRLLCVVWLEEGVSFPHPLSFDISARIPTPATLTGHLDVVVVNGLDVSPTSLLILLHHPHLSAATAVISATSGSGGYRLRVTSNDTKGAISHDSRHSETDPSTMAVTIHGRSLGSSEIAVTDSGVLPFSTKAAIATVACAQRIRLRTKEFIAVSNSHENTGCICSDSNFYSTSLLSSILKLLVLIYFFLSFLLSFLPTERFHFSNPRRGY
jgi:hypothetical protein